MAAKLKQVDVIQRFLSVHGDLYDYSRVDYVRMDVKVEIVCRVHGVFCQRPASHIRGRGCQKCGAATAGRTRAMGFAVFLERSKKVHGSKYAYDQASFNRELGYVTVRCKQHPPFKQAISAHLGGAGCRRCATERTAEKHKVQFSEFLERSERIYGDLLSYSERAYAGLRQPTVITCRIHGEFTQKPKNVLQGYACPLCGQERKTASRTNEKVDVIDKAKKTHAGKYDYSQVSYVRMDVPVTITCPDHGPFKQTLAAHVRGHGCKKCAAVRHPGGHRLSSWVRLAQRSKRFDKYRLYLLSLLDVDTGEKFYKIGRTFLAMNHRMISVPYEWCTLAEVTTETQPEFVYNQECLLKRRTQPLRYLPARPFPGSVAECFLTSSAANLQNIWDFPNVPDGVEVSPLNSGLKKG